LSSHEAPKSLRDGKFTCGDFRGIDYELLNLVLNLVSHAAEHFCSLVRQINGGIWVNDAPVSKVEREWEYWTPFLGRITDRDHVAETALNDCATLCGRCPEMSIPASFITSLAKGFKALGSTPALATSNRLFVRVRRKPSAIRLRVASPVERNRTLGF